MRFGKYSVGEIGVDLGCTVWESEVLENDVWKRGCGIAHCERFKGMRVECGKEKCGRVGLGCTVWETEVLESEMWKSGV